MLTKRVSVKKCEKLTPDFNTESTLYLDGTNKILYKIIKKEFLTLERIKTIEKLSEIENAFLVTPLFGVSLKDWKNIEGFAMKYYSDYITLAKYILSSNLSFEERKQLIYRLSTIFESFKAIGFKYIDVHSDNILINSEGSIKVADTDSGIFEPYKEEDTDYAIINNYITKLYYQILTGKVSFRSVSNSQISRLIGRATPKQQIFLYHSFDRECSLSFNPVDYIEYFDEDIIEDAKLILS